MKGTNNLVFCNRELIQMIELFKEGNFEYFNIITGDVDNLGYLVAENGRAVAQNFVDFTINVIRYNIDKIVSSNISDTIHNVYLPSGEEVSLFSVSNNYMILEHFITSLNEGVNKDLKENDVVGFNNITISFGSHTFRRDEIIELVDQLLSVIKSADQNKIAREYFKLLSFLRKPVERNIDIEKFSNLIGDNKHQVVALRNYVFFKMLQYKTSVAKYLPKFSSIIRSYNSEQLDEITNSFGMNDTKSIFINEIIKENKGLE